MPSLLDRRIATTVGRGRQLSVLKWKKQSEKPTSRYLETSIIVGLKIVISKNGLLYSACMSAKLLLWCLTLCDTIDYNLLGSSVLGILQARILEEWVVISFSKNVQTTIQLYSFHMVVRLCSKSFKLGFSSV